MLKISVKKRTYKLLFTGLIIITIIAVALGVYSTLKTKNDASAYLDGFDPGNIMSDFVMSNKDTMTESQINDFLHSKNPCNRAYDDEVKYYESQGYKYSIKNGRVLCMADDTFNGESAAHIIWQTAQDYNINPQVLIVLLEKEQSLVTDPWPNHRQYASATGFACPDTGGCDSKSAGFKNQVRKAAALFREVLDGGWSNYPAYTTQYILYHTNRNCGGTNVYIQNRATSALYRYTPYQPNAAALAAGTGTGDSCSSYGNRNFYNLFTEWFGNTNTVFSSNIDLPDGIYRIHPATDASKSIDLDAGNRNDGTKIQLWDNIYNSDGQKYQIRRGEDGYYTIASLASDKPISSTPSGKQAEGTKVIQSSNTDSCASKWAITIDNEKYKFVSSCTGLALDMPNKSTENGTSLQIWGDNGSSAQRWDLERIDGQAMPSGLYTISNLKSQKVFDVSNGDHANGGRMQIWSENKMINTQKFEVIRKNDGLYVLKNINSGNVIDLSNANTSNGGRIQTWAYNPSACAQRWNIVPNNEGFSILSSCNNNYAIDIEGSQISIDGAALHLWKYGGWSSQTFTFAQTNPIVQDGTYTILSTIDTNKAVDIDGGSKKASDILHLWSRIDNLKSQQFSIKLENDGYYSIQNVNSRLYVDVRDASSRSGTNIIQWSNNGTCAQRWFIYGHGDGSVSIQSSCSGKNIDVANGGMNNGQKIQTWDQNNTNAQNWILRPV